MKAYVFHFSENRVQLIFACIAILGIALLMVSNAMILLCGLLLVAFGIHELGHMIFYTRKKYPCVGIYVPTWHGLPFGVGPALDRPVRPEDASVIYLSGLISLMVPLFVTELSPVFLILLVAGILGLSIADVRYLLEIKKASKANRHE